MTCSEVREYLFAFLDNELDAPLSIELQRHVDRCHDCAHELEIERTIDHALASSMERDATEPTFDEEVLIQTMKAGCTPPRAGVSRRMLLAASLAAMIVIVPAVYVSWWSNGHSSSSRLADWLVSDLEHFLEDGGHVQIASDERVAVAHWLGGNSNLPVSLPKGLGAQFKLLGGRKCTIDGETAAFAAYDANGVPASLVVLSSEEGILTGLKRVDRAGQTYWIDHYKGHTVVARRRGPLVYAAVSRLPEEQLFLLLTDSLYEGH